MDYQQFLESKMILNNSSGFTIDESEINPMLKPHQRDIVKWAIYGGCRVYREDIRAFKLRKL